MESMEATASTSQVSQSEILKAEKKKVLAALPKKKKSLRLKERRIRESARLRKLIAPKHALLAINEIKGVTMSTFSFTLQANNSTPTFLAESTINGVKYQGTGPSKATAKNDICDQAIRDIMLQKMVEQGKNNPDQDPTKIDDSFPIVTLASYAMHKLFGDWEAEGFNVPGGAKHPIPSSSATVTTNQLDTDTTMVDQSKLAE